MARPRTKARKSYEELLEENAERIRKHTEALQSLENPETQTNQEEAPQE